MKKNSKSVRELCPEVIEINLHGSQPGRPAMHMATVYHCDSPEESDRRLGKQVAGYVYQRDGQPNADALAEKCRQLHQAERAVITSSGMSATSLCFLSTLRSGDHVLLSDRLYGRTTTLIKTELARFGVTYSIVDLQDLASTQTAFKPETQMLVAETISNPMLRVCEIDRLAELAHRNDALLVVDNTFATPIVCQPLNWGADFVIESLTKMMNGHGDVTLGLLCGNVANWDRVEAALSSFGMTPGPTACWLAERGLATLWVRMVAACRTALALATRLQRMVGVAKVFYPGLELDKATQRLFLTCENEPLYGSMLTIQLQGDGDQATPFIKRLREIPYCPSLGDYTTTLSHPVSSSHRSLEEFERGRLGIGQNTIRLSVGLEGVDYLAAAIEQALPRDDA